MREIGLRMVLPLLSVPCIAALVSAFLTLILVYHIPVVVSKYEDVTFQFV